MNVIPRKYKLSEVAEVIRGVSFGSSEGQDRPSENHYPVLRAGNIQSCLLVDTDLVWVPKSRVNRHQLIRQYDIIMCTSSGSASVVGKCARAESNWEGSFGAFCVGIRPNSNKCDPSYLLHYLRSPAFTNWSCQSAGANIKNIRKSELEDFEIPLPPLDEQHRIAAILDKADAIRRKRQESIRLTEEFLRATFLEMFGDPVTNPKGWDKAPIKELGDVMTGNTPSREVQEYYGEGIEWIKSDNINTPFHFLTEAKEYLTPAGQKVGRIVPANSTLVTCIAGSPECIGNAALANRPVAFNQQINAITPFKETDPYFLYVHILVSKKLIQGQSTESMKGMVSKGKFENISFFKPPIKLQEDFGKIFTHFHEMNTKAESSNQESTNLFNSLAQRAFQGEL